MNISSSLVRFSRRQVTLLAVVAAVLSTLAFGAARATHALAASPPGEVMRIDVMTVNGSGCRQGTAAVAVAPDNTAFTVTYSDYMAQVGKGAGATEFRRNCQLNLLMHVPQGFTYAVTDADFRGFTHLEKGATAKQGASYYFQGQRQTVTSNHDMVGPIEKDWQTTDRTSIASLVFAPCGVQRLFNINTELRVNAGTSDTKNTTSFISMDSTDGNIDTIYHFAWKPCV